MGNGLYGENQGNESRSAGRHAETTMMAEQLQDNEICEGDVVKRWRYYFKLLPIRAAGERLQDDFNCTRQQWLAGNPYMGDDGKPKEGEANECARYIANCHNRLWSMLSRATVGNPEILAGMGEHLKDGAKIPADRVR